MTPQVPIEVVAVGPGDDLAAEALALGDSMRAFLGPLPYAAWEEAFHDGRVIAAVNGRGELLGYVLFRLPRHEVVVAHLAVAKSARGQGVARALVNELSGRYHDRLGIRARCRRDFEANRMWPSLGFTPQGNLPGRGKSGQLLTLWWLDHGHGDLLSWGGRTSDRLPVLLDTNVFIDLHGAADDPAGQRTRHLIERVRDQVELLIAPETIREINRNGRAGTREALLRIANNEYPKLDINDATIRAVEMGLFKELKRPPVSARDQSDLKVVATAIAADIPVVLTRDAAARHRLAAAAYQADQVLVTTPAELVAVTLSGNDDNAYVPGALRGTELSTHELASRSRSELHQFIGTDERRGDFEACLDTLAAASPASSRQLIRDQDQEPLALVGYRWDTDALQVPLIRVASHGLRATLATMLTQAVRETAIEHKSRLVKITDPNLGPTLRTVFLRDGYEEGADGLTGIVLTGLYSTDRLRAELQQITAGRAPWQIPDTLVGRSAADLEHRLRPCRITDAALPAWLVPIRPHFADDLFGYPPHLLTRPTRLGLSLEQVYYRSGRQGEQAPGRILWRLSGADAGEVFACSSLIEVRDGTPEDLFRRFRRLGVWTLDQIRTSSGTATRRALRVADTQLFHRSVPLSRLREIASTYSQRLQLRSPCRISPGVFEAIMHEGQI